MRIRKGSLKDTEAYIQMLAQVRAGMEHPEWFYLDAPEDVRTMMADGSMELWLAEEDGQLAGGFDLIRPGLAAHNYGHDLGFTEEELLRVVNMDTAAVLPQYRGRGLQGRMIQHVEAELRREGNRILLCTVHPDNRFSLQNVLKQGYTVQKKLEKYGSVRYILRKDI